jgi:DNA polymerase-3 subunit alpha
MIEDYNIFHDVIIPEDKHVPNDVKIRHLFKDYYDEYEYIRLFAESKHIQDIEFLRLIENGFEKFEQEYNEVNLARINEELGTIWKVSENLNQKLSSYYVLVRNIIHEVMWKFSFVGPARGSVTGFYIAFLTEITQVNPLDYGLPAWRHLHFQRPELPDIDVDSESSKRALIFEGMKEYFGAENVLNTLTLKTEASKSTCLTVMRGLGIDNDIAQVLADLIPFERGANWPFKDCFEGNEEKGRAPVTEFINMVAQYDGLKEMLLMIEGLVSGRSIHASAAYVFTDGYLKQNARMKAPNGVDITAFNMTNSDELSGLKMDVLTVSALDKIHKCIDLLIEDEKIKDMGSIKKNYFTYIDPRKLDYNTPEMWEMLAENSLIDAFQLTSC